MSESTKNDGRQKLYSKPTGKLKTRVEDDFRIHTLESGGVSAQDSDPRKIYPAAQYVTKHRSRHRDIDPIATVRDSFRGVKKFFKDFLHHTFTGQDNKEEKATMDNTDKAEVERLKKLDDERLAAEAKAKAEAEAKLKAEKDAADKAEVERLKKLDDERLAAEAKAKAAGGHGHRKEPPPLVDHGHSSTSGTRIVIVPESSNNFLAFIIGMVCVIALASGWIFYSFRDQNVVHETSRATESRIAAEKAIDSAHRAEADAAIRVAEAKAEAYKYREERIVPQPFGVLVARTVVDLSTSAPPVAPTITTPAPLAPTPPTPSTTPPAPPNADQPRGSMEHHNPSGCRHHPHEHCACVWLNVQQLPPRITVFPGNIHWSSGPLMGNTYFKIEGVEGWWSNDR